MSGNVTVSVATSSVNGLVAIVAILANNQRFNSIEKRLDKIERTLEVIQSDLKEF